MDKPKRSKGMLVFYVSIALGVVLLVAAPLAWWNWSRIKGYWYISRMCERATPGHKATAQIEYAAGLNTFTDEISSAEIGALYWASVERITHATRIQPKVYEYQDALTWPRLRAVWQLEDHYLSVLVAMNNDNDSISWMAAQGQYDVAEEASPVPAVIVKGKRYKLPTRKDWRQELGVHH